MASVRKTRRVPRRAAARTAAVQPRLYNQQQRQHVTPGRKRATGKQQLRAHIRTFVELVWAVLAVFAVLAAAAPHRPSFTGITRHEHCSGKMSEGRPAWRPAAAAAGGTFGGVLAQVKEKASASGEALAQAKEGASASAQSLSAAVGGLKERAVSSGGRPLYF